MRAITCLLTETDRELGETEQRQRTDHKRSDENVPCDFRGGKKQKKKMCHVYYTRGVYATFYYTTLMNVESSFGSSQRVVTPRGSILLLYIFLPRFSPFASFASSSSSSPLGRVLSVSAVALGSV